MKEFADLVIEEGAPFNYKWYVRQLRHVSSSLSCLLLRCTVAWCILVASL
jgi:hypothetical protein